MLYVGATDNIEARAHAHSKSKDWWCLVDQSRTVIERFTTKIECSQRERDLIERFAPLFNRLAGGYPTGSSPAPVPHASGNPALAHLVALRVAWAQRGELIRLARAQGATWEQIADAIKLSRMTVISLSKLSPN